MLQEIKEGIIKTVVLTLIGILAGVAMLFIPHEKLVHISFVILGFAIILFMLPEFIHQIQFFQEEPFYEFILTCIIMALGFALIFFQRSFMYFAVGGVMLAIPVFKIFTSNAKWAMFRTQLPCLILGIILLILGPAKSIKVFFTIAGYAIIALSLAYLVYSLVFLLPSKKSKAIQKEYKNIGDE